MHETEDTSLNHDSLFQAFKSSVASGCLKESSVYAPYFDEISSSTGVTIVFYDTISTDFDQHSIVNGDVKVESFDESSAPSNFVVFVMDDDFYGVPHLPWRRCYCTRGRNYEDNNGNWVVSSYGECSAGINDEHCGRCGRANFHGDCSGAGCPGC